MTEKEKNIVSKLEIIKSMSNDVSTKELTNVFIEYISTKEKTPIGFAKAKK